MDENYFRFINDSELSAERGLAIDEAIVNSVAHNQSIPILHLYSFLPSVIIGRYQNLVDAIDVGICQRYNIRYNRRHTGGGTVLMGSEQLAIGFAVLENSPYVSKTIHGNFKFFADILKNALSEFSIQSEFEGKNDLQVNGRKIAGLAISQDINGAIFFHTSLLIDFDIDLMTKILRLPTGKLSDKGISCFTERMTTIKQEIGNIKFQDVENAVLKAFENKLNMKYMKDTLSDDEEGFVEKLVKDKYQNDEWIFSSRVAKRWNGYSIKKTLGGVLRIFLTLSQGVIESIMITGDYFSRNKDIIKLESRLKYSPSNKEVVLNEIRKINKEIIYRIDEELLTESIMEAVEDAKRKKKSQILDKIIVNN